MPTQAYILNHELFQALQAVELSGAGKAELETLAHYDVDPLEQDAEDRVIEIIRDQSECARADRARKAA